MDKPLMCDRPDDCPNGPYDHQFSPPQNLMCCCRQLWEEQMRAEYRGAKDGEDDDQATH